MREAYIEATTSIIQRLDVESLKKVYTVAKKLLEFQEEKGGAEHGEAKKEFTTCN